MKTEEQQLRGNIKRWIIFFIIALIFSGITAFPIESQLAIAINHLDIFPSTVQRWLSTIYHAVKTTNNNFPYLAYGTDWLAFAHIVIATAFIGPLRDPVRNIWVIQLGMIACVMVLPLAFIAGPKAHFLVLATNRLLFRHNWYTSSISMLQKHQKIRISTTQQ